MGRRFVVAVVAGLAALGGSVEVAPRSASAATNCEGGLSSSALDDMFRGRLRGPGGLLGMDYAHAHPLPDGRVLWLFQDAFLGDVPTLDAGAFVHNVGLIQFGSCARVLHSGPASAPRSWIGASQEVRLARWFWPLDGAVGADGQFHQFMVEMRNANGTGAAVGATPTRVWVASIRLSDLVVTRFAPAPDDDDRPLYGFSVTSDADFTYLYGHCYRQFTNPGYAGAHDTSCGPDMYVARVGRGRLLDVPQYWNGSAWVASRGDAVPVMRRGSAANPMQVRQVGGTYVSVTKLDDWFGVRVYLDTAPAATGPWTPVAEFSPDLVCGQCTTYFAHLLPWRDTDGRLLVAISNNAWSHSDAIANPLVYRPRIISVKAPAGVIMGDPPPDCTISATLREGSSGSAVRCVRRRLAALGYPVTTGSSRFDAALKTAVTSFQRARGLAADGIVGPGTAAALKVRGGRTVAPGGIVGPRACQVTSTLSYGSRGSQVRCLNQRLQGLGYTITGSADVFGASTRTAVKQFQAGRGLSADGIVGPATRRALGW